MSIPVIRGHIPAPTEKEYKEMMNYESGKGNEDAKNTPGPYPEPWLNVIHTHEPASIPAFDRVVAHPEIRKGIHGTVLDLGAGTCWLSAKLSLLPEVKKVYSLDLSEKFLMTVGTRILNYFRAHLEKINFVISDFNKIPLEDESVDAAFFFASLHHSLVPVKTLQEVGRCVKKGGMIYVLENPTASIHIEAERKKCLEISKEVTEFAHTKRDWEYLIKVANVGPFTVYPFDILSRGGLKGIVRKLLRKWNIEDLIINPPTYLFAIKKE